MKKEIAEWKKHNGNVTYSVKELLQGIHIKIDKIQDTMVTQHTCSRRVSVTRKMVIGMFGLLFTLIGSLAGYVFYK